MFRTRLMYSFPNYKYCSIMFNNKQTSENFACGPVMRFDSFVFNFQFMSSGFGCKGSFASNGMSKYSMNWYTNPFRFGRM